MEKQPEALRLANVLESRRMDDVYDADYDLKAADELRRLHEVNQELLEALAQIAAYRPLTFAECSDAEAVIGLAENAIAKAEAR